jgi:hypothetical protein
LRILFFEAAIRHDNWGWASFYISQMGETGTMFAASLAGNVLDDVARNSGVAFFAGPTLLQSYSLKGSSAAVTKLRQCAQSQAKHHPIDLLN